MKVTIVRDQTHDVERRLEEIGLTRQVLQQAVETGESARDACTAFHPTTYFGLSAWAETTAALRELLGQHGWESTEERNQPLAVSPTGTVAIVVASGDLNTGRPDRVPHTEHPKGIQTFEAVHRNTQLQIFGPEVQDETRETWILLRHRTPDDEVRFELSLPASIGDDGRVVGWVERILFAPIQLTDYSASKAEDQPLPDVDVKRKRLN